VESPATRRETTDLHRNVATKPILGVLPGEPLTGLAVVARLVGIDEAVAAEGTLRSLHGPVT